VRDEVGGWVVVVGGGNWGEPATEIWWLTEKSGNAVNGFDKCGSMIGWRRITTCSVLKISQRLGSSGHAVLSRASSAVARVRVGGAGVVFGGVE
jgi:hypothetical protein